MARVDLLGLNEFGEAEGLNPIWGTVIGGGVTGLAKVLFHKMGKPNPDFWALAAGGATAAAMYFNLPGKVGLHKQTRHAAIGAAVGAFLAAGIDWVFDNVFASKPTGLPVINQLGLPQIEYMQPMHGASLGAPVINAVPPAYPPGMPGPVYGANLGGVAGPQLAASAAPPVDLFGPDTAQSTQVSLMGGPPISGLSSAYGATLLGQH